MRLAPDPAVPARDALLRADVVARLAGAAGARGERVYAKYRVGESLRVVHRIEVGGRGHHVSARTFPDSQAAYERALGSAVPAPLRPVVHLPELGAVLWSFPNDRRLEALPLLRPGSVALTRLLGRPCAAVRLSSYAPERCATAACLDDGGRVLAFAKVHAGDGAERERRRLEAAADAVRVPRVMAVAGDGSVLLLEPLGGQRADVLLPEAVSGLGEALASLHAAAPVPDAAFTRLAPERLARAVATIARARPDAAPAATRLLGRLLSRAHASDGPTVCLHGDANLRNAIVRHDGVALLDLEDGAAGPAAADLGQLLAGLLAERALGRMSAAEEDRLAGGLLAGYARVATLPEPETLRWHTAASVLARVALPAVNRVRPAVLDRLVPLLEEAWR
jgi:aminoglycoside phosphotransferase